MIRFAASFIRHHAKGFCAYDFLTQRTAFFSLVYVFVVMEAVRGHGPEGLPIPYGAPDASPHIEPFMARSSHAIHGIPDPYPELTQPPPLDGRLVALPVLDGIQHDYCLIA